jgi:hypothetical protein
MATSQEYRHMPTSTLSRFAQRAGKVYASASTWLRLIQERGWRGLRNCWLYSNTLDSEAAVRRLVAFYVNQFNEVMPHSALDWRTPDEVYLGRADDVPHELKIARRVAREARRTLPRRLTA